MNYQSFPTNRLFFLPTISPSFNAVHSHHTIPANKCVRDQGVCSFTSLPERLSEKILYSPYLTVLFHHVATPRGQDKRKFPDSDRQN